MYKIIFLKTKTIYLNRFQKYVLGIYKKANKGTNFVRTIEFKSYRNSCKI